ncbi:MAG TPA: histidine kinase, partial [Chitinophagaceae bacterium]|nr:histidine kinase [Chitinophagaceae bacterium]
TKPDNAGRIWSMFYNKISVFIPGPDRFYTFKLPFGEANRNYYNYLSKRSNGNMFGTIGNELVEFFPDRIEAVPAKIKPQISQLIVNGKSIQLIKDGRVLLHPNENTIRFRFGVLTDRNVFPYDIEYMLEGAEEGWTTAAGNNEALYNNLHPGSYRFKVRAKGQNTAWQTEEAVLQITIKTPFYKATWFLLTIGLLVLASIVFLYRYRLAQKEKLLLLESKAQKLEKEKVMVMYENLKQQLNPHFLFNSLTSLSGLIEMDQKMAGNFLEQMSDIYRYILKNGDNETVTVKDEIEFVKVYINLQQTRFRQGLVVNIEVPDSYLHYKIAPVTLQNLIENAIKHNIIDSAFPLVIDIFIEGDYLVVRNNLQRKRMVETSNKKGLAQFISLYRYLSRMPVLIEESDQYFQIKVPLI